RTSRSTRSRSWGRRSAGRCGRTSSGGWARASTTPRRTTTSRTSGRNTRRSWPSGRRKSRPGPAMPNPRMTPRTTRTGICSRSPRTTIHRSKDEHAEAYPAPDPDRPTDDGVGRDEGEGTAPADHGWEGAWHARDQVGSGEAALHAGGPEAGRAAQRGVPRNADGDDPRPRGPGRTARAPAGRGLHRRVPDPRGASMPALHPRARREGEGAGPGEVLRLHRPGPDPLQAVWEGNGGRSIVLHHALRHLRDPSRDGGT